MSKPFVCVVNLVNGSDDACAAVPQLCAFDAPADFHSVCGGGTRPGYQHLVPCG